MNHIDVDLVDVQKFISSEEFIQFLLNNTYMGVSTFILQTVHDKIKEIEEEGLE